MNNQISFTQSQLDLLLTAASRAPSGGNIQPWLVDVNNNTLLVKLNPKLLGTLLDVNNFASIFSLGSFCLNLEIAASHCGIELQSSISETKQTKSFSVKYTLVKLQKPQKHPLFPSIAKRTTNRQLSDGTIIAKNVLNQLSHALNDHNYFDCHLVSSNQDKSSLASILGKADLIRTKNKTLLSQMLSEIRWSHQEAATAKDGIDIKTMELPGNVSRMLQLLSKFPNLASSIPDIALEKQAWPLLKHSSHLGVISLSDSITPESMFFAGKAVQEYWLMATKLNLAFHPWTVLSFLILRAKFFPNSGLDTQHEEELLELETYLKSLMKINTKSTPIFIFRLSNAKPPSTTSLRHHWKTFTTIAS